MKTVLIVDDDKSIREILRVVISEAGYKVKTSSNPDIVHTAGTRKKRLPDLILLDYMLSGYNGTNISQNLKNNKHTKNIPIILMSAYSDLKVRAKDSLADDFLVKPFGIDELLKMIKKYI